QGLSGAAVLRGLGVPVTKSVLLLSLSVQPAFVRIAAVLLLRLGVGPVPSKQLVPVPYPTISTTVGPEGQFVPLVIKVFTFSKATLPATEAIEIVPVTSGFGRLPPVVPIDSLIRKYCPGASVTFDRSVFCHEVPVVEAYWTDQPFKLTGELPRLNSS